VTCVLDTDAVIGALDRADAHHAQAARYVRALQRRGEPMLLSVVNHAEALVRPSSDAATLAAAEQAISDIGIEVVPAPASLGREAALLRGHGVSLGDAFALATARAHGAQLLSFDARVRRALPAAGVSPARA